MARSLAKVLAVRGLLSAGSSVQEVEGCRGDVGRLDGEESGMPAQRRSTSHVGDRTVLRNWIGKASWQLEIERVEPPDCARRSSFFAVALAFLFLPPTMYVEQHPLDTKPSRKGKEREPPPRDLPTRDPQPTDLDEKLTRATQAHSSASHRTVLL
ncbi:hypothetical protein NLJ89_g11509 [Agrocybe chaxingu]|uniref:Uncharacterized protein n=1 Tax=Agrocybe chaxingu TaxID=84603 RepID=A0A9W8JS82_9AGAR|nr:hypothetical protein NLJ89_g11509 [Agrocybe chaxingu]